MLLNVRVHVSTEMIWKRMNTYQSVNNGYQWVAEFQFPLCFFSNFSPRNVELMGRRVEEKKETNVHWEMGL